MLDAGGSNRPDAATGDPHVDLAGIAAAGTGGDLGYDRAEHAISDSRNRLQTIHLPLMSHFD
jgi:hypothetical protein